MGEINIGYNVDEGKEEYTGMNGEIGAEVELEQANEEINEEGKIIEDVINKNEADEGAVITGNEENLSAEYTIENEESDNNEESEEISPETNIETIAEDEYQRSASAVDENDIKAQRSVIDANLESQRSDPRQMMAI